MKVLITGGTGLIGKELTRALLEKNHEVIVTGRKSLEHFRDSQTLPCEYLQWENPASSELDLSDQNIEAVIHLLGEPVAGGRWTQKRKKSIRESRVLSTKNIVNSISKSNSIHTLISASAIGYYGDQTDNILSESHPVGSDFLAQVCKDWEAESQKANVRNIQLRLGVVLAQEGGALDKMLPIFENGFGGVLASGKQWMSWIHIEDVVRIIMESLENSQLNGPINCVSPNPVRNKEFTKQLARALKTRAFLPVPGIALKLLYGEMSQVLLASLRASPVALKKINFTFKYPSLKEALDNLFGWKESRFDRIFNAEHWMDENENQVFDFFCNERNLEQITPPLLNFKVLNKSTPEIKEGTLIHYKLKIRGVPARWTTLIKEWKPKTEFTDTQIKGPYAKWHHRHSFTPLKGGVLMKDRVIYRLPFAQIGGNLLHSWIRKDVQSIFSYRKQTIEKLFGN